MRSVTNQSFTAPLDQHLYNIELRQHSGSLGTEDTANSPSENSALQAALQKIARSYGPGAVMRLGHRQQPVPTFSSGALPLDIALGGGYPKGRVLEVFGPESSGKTTLALHAIASIQQAGGTAAFIDAEHALDPIYARAIGIKTPDLLVSQPDCGETALAIADHLIRSNAVDLVVIDSVAALVPRAEIEGQMGQTHVGLQARLMSQALRKLTSGLSHSQCTLMFINQIRQKIGTVYGSPETTPGGNALKFYASIRLDLRRIQTLKQGGQTVGSRVRVRAVKNKVAPPFRFAELDILFAKGFDRSSALLDMAERAQLICRRGSHYYVDVSSATAQPVANGRMDAIAWLDNHPDIALMWDSTLREQHNISL